MSDDINEQVPNVKEYKVSTVTGQKAIIQAPSKSGHIPLDTTITSTKPWKPEKHKLAELLYSQDLNPEQQAMEHEELGTEKPADIPTNGYDVRSADVIEEIIAAHNGPEESYIHIEISDDSLNGKPLRHANRIHAQEKPYINGKTIGEEFHTNGHDKKSIPVHSPTARERRIEKESGLKIKPEDLAVDEKPLKPVDLVAAMN